MTPRALVLLSLAATLLSCSAAQDLGHDERSGEAPIELPVAAHGAGFGATWACPDSPLARDLACPLTAPIHGEACSPRATAPCAYPAEDSDGSEVCLCSKQLRWVCLGQASFRTLDAEVRSSTSCLESAGAPEVTRPCVGEECTACGGPCEVTCRCVGDAYRCGDVP